ncbi:ATP-binding protein [Embleya sp. NPDC001921]
MLVPTALLALLCVGSAIAAITVPCMFRARRRAVRAETALRIGRAEHAHTVDALTTAENRALRREGGLRTLMDETKHLVGVRLPGLLSHLANPDEAIPPVLHPHFAESEPERLHRELMDLVTAAVHGERAATEKAAREILRQTAADAWGLSMDMRLALLKAQRRVADPGLLTLVSRLQQINEQIAHRWSMLAIACGNEAPSSDQSADLTEVIADAQARFAPRQRTRPVHYMDAGSPVRVRAHAVGPLTTVLAELLPNGEQSSTNGTSVSVEIHEVTEGVVVIIEDSEGGLDAEEHTFVEQALSGRSRNLPTELGSAERVGFTAIGRILRAHPLTVDVSILEHGGLAATVHIGWELLTRPADRDAVPRPTSGVGGRANGQRVGQVADFS